MKRPCNNSFCHGKILVLAATLAISACSWVKVTDEGQSVELLTDAQVQSRDCERIGQTSSKVLHKVWFVKRNAEKQERELANLARNEAATMGGNAVVRDGEIEEGRQRFVIYNCS